MNLPIASLRQLLGYGKRSTCGPGPHLRVKSAVFRTAVFMSVFDDMYSIKTEFPDDQINKFN